MRTKRATRLRHAPKERRNLSKLRGWFAHGLVADGAEFFGWGVLVEDFAGAGQEVDDLGVVGFLGFLDGLGGFLAGAEEEFVAGGAGGFAAGCVNLSGCAE